MERPDFTCIIGIDPGKSGGIAVWRKDEVTKVYRMPKNISDLRPLIQHFKSVHKTIVFLEKVQLRPDDMTSPGKAFRVQFMLQDFQKLKDMIEVEEVPYILTHPMSWQSYLNLRKKGREEKKDRKNRYKEAAQSYYPECKVALWNADALLIMHFGRKKLLYDVKWMLENLPKEQHSKFVF